MVPNNESQIEDIRHCDNLLTASIVCSLVSLIVGGIPLSFAAVVLSIIALFNLRKVAKVTEQPMVDGATRNKNLKRKTTLAILISIAAFLVNLISFIVLFPAVMEYLNYADSSTMFEGLLGGSAQQGATGTNSVWG